MKREVELITGYDENKFEDSFQTPPSSSPDLKLDNVISYSVESERGGDCTEYPSSEPKVKNYKLCLPPTSLVPRDRLSSTSSSESGSEHDSPLPQSLPLSQIVSACENKQETLNINSINFNKGCNSGFHHGPQINYTVVQNIKLPGDEECPSSVLKSLKSNAEKINKEVRKQISAAQESPTLKSLGEKSGTKVLHSERYSSLLQLITVICVILMAITIVIFLVTASHKQSSSSFSPSNKPSLTGETFSSYHVTGKLEGADMPDGPLMWDRDTWLAQPPACARDNLSLPVTEVVVCHTATDSCYSQPECVKRVRNIQQFHIESRKWCDIAYNFLIGGDGGVYEGRGWNLVGAHTKSHNHGTLGIAFIGTFVDVLPNPDQLQAFKMLLDVGVRLGKIAPDYSLVAQCQLKVTTAPGWTLVQHLYHWPHFNQSLPIHCVPPNPEQSQTTS